MRRKMKLHKRFAMVDKEILYSSSWAELPYSAMVVYVHLKGEFVGYNKKELKLPYSQMKGIMSSATFWRAINMLEKIGFIDRIQRGGLEKNPNVYALSDRWRLREKSMQEYQEEFRQRAERNRYMELVESTLEEH